MGPCPPTAATADAGDGGGGAFRATISALLQFFSVFIVYDIGTLVMLVPFSLYSGGRGQRTSENPQDKLQTFIFLMGGGSVKL